MTLRTTSLLALALSAAPLVAFAAVDTTYFSDLGYSVIRVINGTFVPVLFAVAFIVFLFGVAKTYIFSNGDPTKVKAGHTLILWGLIGFAVMLSVWGLVNIVDNTFGLRLAAPTSTQLPKGPTTSI